MKLFSWGSNPKKEIAKPVKEPTVQDTTMKILDICNSWDEASRRKILTDVAYMAFDVPYYLHRSARKNQEIIITDPYKKVFNI